MPPSPLSPPHLFSLPHHSAAVSPAENSGIWKFDSQWQNESSPFSVTQRNTRRAVQDPEGFMHDVVFMIYLGLLSSLRIIKMLAGGGTQTDDEVWLCSRPGWLPGDDKWNLAQRKERMYRFLFLKVCSFVKSAPSVSQQRWQPFARSWWSSAMELAAKHACLLFSAKTSFLKSTSRLCSRTTSLTSRLTGNRFVPRMTKAVGTVGLNTG